MSLNLQIRKWAREEEEEEEEADEATSTGSTKFLSFLKSENYSSIIHPQLEETREQ